MASTLISMHVISINLSLPKPFKVGNRDIATGIFKEAAQAATLTRLGFGGDQVGNPKHHGGPDQAVYVYSADDYAWWAEQLGFQLEPGTFGENLTLSTFGRDEVRIGERFKVGQTLLEVTAPRIPCATLAARMDDPGFVKRFRQARRPGFYARVLQTGQVQSGDPVERTPARTRYPSIGEVFDLWYEANPAPEALREVLLSPLAERARQYYRQQLESLA